MQVAHDVSILIGTDLIHLTPCDGDHFSYTCEGDDAVMVRGALIDDRFVPREKAEALQPGKTFEITEDDVVHALETIRPMERCPKSKLQVIAAAIDSYGQADKLDSEECFRVVTPTIFLDPPEMIEQWHDRTYCQRTEDNKHPVPGYERDLIVRMPDDRKVRLRGCRPAGFDEQNRLVLRFLAFEYIK